MATADIPPLARYRVLSPKCPLKVSPLCLGAMSLGAKMGKDFGEVTLEEAFAYLDHYYNQGGNFIDTAVSYQKGDSEKYVGAWMKARGNRNDMVIATKFSGYSPDEERPIKINYVGNHAKSMKLALETSLERLQTDYIDIFYVHWGEHLVSPPQLMQALHHLVTSGKVLYLGISDTPAWFVASCNAYARCMGLSEFSVYQGWWSLAVRDMEKEVLPMCRSEGMALVPFGVMGAGKFRSQKQVEELKQKGQSFRTAPGYGDASQSESDIKVSATLEEVGDEIGVPLQSVALAHMLQKAPHVFPLIGGRKIEQLSSNIEALKVSLTEEQVVKLEAASPLDPGFPYWICGTDPTTNGGKMSWSMAQGGHVDYVQAAVALQSNVAGTRI
ncbi:Aldo/keto reductase [Atractiella rhizophila]|nr:Aldo/keto reductase [Atractiella rhizophila]